MKIESLSGKVIRERFSEELRTGLLAFREMNVEEPGNRHFIDDYRLTSQSLVIVEYRDGRQVRWKNLEKVWTLLGSEKEFLPVCAGRRLLLPERCVMTPVVDLGAVSALWLGILTSMSPCPLATNIAAVSYIGRQYRSPAKMTFSSLAYVLGRMGAYLALGALLVAGLLSAPGMSMFLQKSMNKILGPVLILAGMVLLDLLRFPTFGRGIGEKMREKAGQGGIPGAGLLGILFALSFCRSPRRCSSVASSPSRSAVTPRCSTRCSSASVPGSR